MKEEGIDRGGKMRMKGEIEKGRSPEGSEVSGQ